MSSHGKGAEGVPKLRKTDERKPTKPGDETLGSRIELCCTAVQKFLFDAGTGSERSIREACGDNPDTSKALRMLLKQNKVRRFGTGGRADPFVYVAVATPQMSDLERLKEARAAGII